MAETPCYSRLVILHMPLVDIAHNKDQLLLYLQQAPNIEKMKKTQEGCSGWSIDDVRGMKMVAVSCIYNTEGDEFLLVPIWACNFFHKGFFGVLYTRKWASFVGPKSLKRPIISRIHAESLYKTPRLSALPKSHNLRFLHNFVSKT